MPDLRTVPPRTPKRIGVAADHGGFESKEYLVGVLRKTDYEVVDFGDRQPQQDDDYPDFVVPLARAVARGEVDRGVAICGSGVGACIAANKVPGVRACLIHECFSAHQGVEDDDMNVICLGGHVVGNAIAWELVRGSSKHDSVAPTVTGVVWLKLQGWKAGRRNHERQPFETDGNAGVIHLAGLHPERPDRQRRATVFDRGGWAVGDAEPRGRHHVSAPGAGTGNLGMPITALFLDIGGVLLSDGWDHRGRKLAAKTFNLDRAEMEDRHHLTFGAYEEGKLTLEEYLGRVVFYQKRPFTRAQFRRFMFAQSGPYPEMIELIAQLKVRHGLKIAAVSNEARELHAYRIRKFKLDRFVDSFISSCFVHIRKPDADIFRLALDIAQTPARQVVYIENTPMFVQVAEGLGIRSILHTDYRSTCAKLASFGLQSDARSRP